MKRNIIGFLLLFGFVACGTVEQENGSVSQQSRDNGVDSTASSTGKQLYKSCEGCHGEKGEKEALGKSELIGGQSYAVTKYQLEEYRAGRLSLYGFGGVMKGQSQLTQNEISLLSRYIESLSGTITVSTTPAPTVNDRDISAACKGCHGATGEVRAFDKSRIIKDMTRLDIYNALVGYQNGTYGGDMKGLMKAQASNFSKSELKDLARYFGL